MQTVISIGTFESKALKLLGEDEYFKLIAMLAAKPKAGTLIKGTGGLRKVRIQGSGRGKRGGLRVIYYYHNANKPILMLLIYAKAKSDDMSEVEKKSYKKIVQQIIDEFK